MENPTVLSTSSSGRRNSASNSPEFEFWMVTNPSCPQTFLHSADELFSGGVLVPLHLLNIRNSDDPPDKHATFDPPNIPTVVTPDLGPASESTLTTLTASKRWKDIFKKTPESKEKDKKKKATSAVGGGGGMSMAELNINLWPFSRSRSAGNGGSRPRSPIAGNRKVSSAPCSRSNSAGESKSRKWPNSPNRGGDRGVYVGRSSPVWQMNRVGSGRSLHDNLVRNSAEKGVLKKEKPAARRSKKYDTGGDTTATVGAKSKVLNLNVQACIGYRHQLSCRSDEIQEENTLRVAGIETRATGVHSDGEGIRGTNMFTLRNLFAKKVY